MIFLAFSKKYTFIVFLLSIFAITACGKKNIYLGATTTLEDSGLLQALIQQFEKEHTVSIKPVIAGSGQLFALIKRGDIDLAISHEPDGELKLLKQGKVKERIPLFHSHFVIIGVKQNPANISKHDSPQEALQRIQEQQQPFISRGDHSGTHKMELSLRRKLPSSSSAFIIETGTGMGATLNIAINRNAYTLVDTGTWLNFGNKRRHQILWGEKNNLINPYHLLITDSRKAEINVFKEWLNKTSTKTFIKNYRLQGQSVFYNSLNN